MGQIVSSAAKPKRCNLNQLSQVPTPAAGEYILVSSDNSMNANGQGNFDCYIEGNGTTAASALPIHSIVSGDKVIAQALSIQKEKIDELEENLKEKLGEDEALVIAQALVDIKDSVSEDSEISSSYSVTDELTVSNSDVIVALGSSFGTGSYNLKGKNWIAKLSLFSDYQFKGLTYDGANYTFLLRYIRMGALSFSGNYALLACNENTSISLSSRLKSLVNIAEYLKTYGATPILATSYTDEQFQSSLWKRYADENNYMFWDAAKYCSLIRDARGGNGDSGRHLGTRNSQMVTDGYLPYMQRMRRPKKSIKFFRLRSFINSSVLDNLLFFSNEERAEKYYEFYLGGQCVQDSADVDVSGSSANTSFVNEYNSLSSSAVSISRPMLISAIIPIEAKDLKMLSLNIDSSDTIEVYVLNRKIEPYPVQGTYSRFSIEDTIVKPSVGAVYSTNGNNYTVVSIIDGENDYFCTIYCSPQLSSTINAGTLTKVSGEGPSTINYVLGESSTLNEENTVLSDTVGHWDEVTSTDNRSYYLDQSQLRSCVAVDKVHFLVVSSGETSISNVSIKSGGDCFKRDSFNREYEYNTIYWKDAELVPEPTFGATGTTSSHWKDDEGNYVTSTSVYENKYPTGTNSVISLSGSDYIECNVGAIQDGGNYILEVWSRYFPPIYTDGTGNQITLDSYDYETLNVTIYKDFTTEKNNVTFNDEIGTYWKISQFPLEIYTPDNLSVRIGSTNKGLEICKVSLKKID